MSILFRHRILLVLIAVGTIPTAVAILGWALTVRATGPSGEIRGALAGVGASGRALVETIDTTHLTPAERRALDEHTRQLNGALSRIQRTEASSRFYYTGLTVIILVLGAVVLYASVRLGGHLSRQLGRPIDELVQWADRVGQGLPLPAEDLGRGAPEFAELRAALRHMAEELRTGRLRELEAERLRAFREIARRVAHEIKNPLTSMRIAVDQLQRSGAPADGRTGMAVDVLSAETDRLDNLAREFAEFGRLPEGPQSEVDVVELLEELGRSAVPAGVQVTVRANGGRRMLVGHYEPLRRAFSNLLRNASEAMAGQGQIDVGVAEDGGGLVITIADHGPGIPEDQRHQVFQPYFTTKPDGTGLGLSLVRQTLEAHRGSIRVEETPGGGATFRLVFPG